MEPSGQPKIYCWINVPTPQFLIVLAVAEDGELLGSHCSSHPVWAQRDIGCAPGGASGNHLAAYAEHYPDGYELIWIEGEAIKTHEGLLAALEKNAELGRIHALTSASASDNDKIKEN